MKTMTPVHFLPASSLVSGVIIAIAIGKGRVKKGAYWGFFVDMIIASLSLY